MCLRTHTSATFCVKPAQRVSKLSCVAWAANHTAVLAPVLTSVSRQVSLVNLAGIPAYHELTKGSLGMWGTRETTVGRARELANLGTVRSMQKLPTPTASAPILYGRRSPSPDLLPWAWAEDRLSTAHNYWISTVHPSARPHSRPVWGVWLDTGFWFSTGGLARFNLAENDQISVHLEDAMRVVIVEGAAAPITDPAALRNMSEIYSRKYDYPIRPSEDGVEDDEGNSGPAFRVIPQVVFAWDDEMSSPTRWTFVT